MLADIENLEISPCFLGGCKLLKNIDKNAGHSILK